MGADCIITLPHDVRVWDVACVVGILAGLNPAWETHGDAKCVRVDGVEVRECGVVAGANIIICGDLVDGSESHAAFYHFEGARGEGRILRPRSTPFWCAVACGLVKAFGGNVDYNDSDSVDVDYTAKKPRKSNSPIGGKPWGDFQKDMYTIKPLTKADLAKFAKYAGYK